MVAHRCLDLRAGNAQEPIVQLHLAGQAEALVLVVGIVDGEVLRIAVLALEIIGHHVVALGERKVRRHTAHHEALADARTLAEAFLPL